MLLSKMIGPTAYHQVDFRNALSTLSCELDYTSLPQNHRNRSMFDNHGGRCVTYQSADSAPQVAAISTVNVNG